MEVENESDHNEDEYLNFIGIYPNDVPYDELMKEEFKEIEIKQRHSYAKEMNTNR